MEIIAYCKIYLSVSLKSKVVSTWKLVNISMKQEGSNPQLPTLPPHMYTKNSPVCELSHPTDDFQPTLTTNNFPFSSPTKKKEWNSRHYMYYKKSGKWRWKKKTIKKIETLCSVFYGKCRQQNEQEQYQNQSKRAIK